MKTIKGIVHEEDKRTKQYKATNSNNKTATTDDKEQLLESDNEMEQREQAKV